MIDINGANRGDASVAKEILLIDKCLSDDLRDIEQRIVPSGLAAGDEDDSDSDCETRSPRTLAMMRDELRQANTQMLAEVVAGHMAAAARRQAAFDRVLALKRSRSHCHQSHVENSTSRSCGDKRYTSEREKSSLPPSNVHLLSEVTSRHQASAARRAAALQRVVALKSARLQRAANHRIRVDDGRVVIDAVEDSDSNPYSNESCPMPGRQEVAPTRVEHQDRKDEGTSSPAASEAAAVTHENNDPIQNSEKNQNFQAGALLIADSMVNAAANANSTADGLFKRFSSPAQSRLKSGCVQTDVENWIVCPPSEKEIYSVQMPACKENDGKRNLRTCDVQELESSQINFAPKEPSRIKPDDIGDAARNALRSSRLISCDAKHKTFAICNDAEEKTRSPAKESGSVPKTISAIGSGAISALGESPMKSGDKDNSDATQTRNVFNRSADHGQVETLPESHGSHEFELYNKPSAVEKSNMQRHQDVQSVTVMTSMTELRTATHSNSIRSRDAVLTSIEVGDNLGTVGCTAPSTELEDRYTLDIDDMLPAFGCIGVQQIVRAPFTGNKNMRHENTELLTCATKAHRNRAATVEAMTAQNSYSVSDHGTAPSLSCQHMAVQPSVPQDRRLVRGSQPPTCGCQDANIPGIRSPTGRVLPLRKEDTWELDKGDQIRIERRGSRKLPYILHRGDTIRWRFRLQNGPVGFGVCKRTMSNGGAVESEVIATSRFDSSRSYSGEWLATKSTTIVLVFDNSFSMFRAKGVVCSIIIDRASSKTLAREAANGEMDIAQGEPHFEAEEGTWEARYKSEWRELHDAKAQ